jgi:hypothetical protein
MSRLPIPIWNSWRTAKSAILMHLSALASPYPRNLQKSEEQPNIRNAASAEPTFVSRPISCNVAFVLETSHWQVNNLFGLGSTTLAPVTNFEVEAHCVDLGIEIFEIWCDTTTRSADFAPLVVTYHQKWCNRMVKMGGNSCCNIPVNSCVVQHDGNPWCNICGKLLYDTIQ